MKRNLPLMMMIAISTIVFLQCMDKGVFALTLSGIGLFGFLILFYYFNSKKIHFGIEKIMNNTLPLVIVGFLQLDLFLKTISQLVKVPKENYTKILILFLSAGFWFLAFLLFAYSIYKNLKSNIEKNKVYKYYIGYSIGLIAFIILYFSL